MSEELKDKVTEFGDAPDMDALHQEYDNAWAQDQYTGGRLSYVERIRYARWPGQSEDGQDAEKYAEGRGRKSLLRIHPKRENEKIARMAQLTQSQRDGEDFRGPICSPCG